MLKVLMFVLLVSILIYGLVRVIERRGVSRRAPKPLAPDDDLDFLRDIDWQQKKDRQRRRKNDGGASSDSGSGGTPNNDPDDDGPGDPGDSGSSGGSDGGGGGD